VITVDLRGGMAKNARWGLGIGLFTGGLGALVGTAVLVSQGIGLIAAPIGASLLGLLGAGTIGGFRLAYRSAISGVRRELGHLLDAVEASARTQDVFTAPMGRRVADRSSDRDRSGS
jgi:hypothetical protein